VSNLSYTWMCRRIIWAREG